MKLTKLEQSGLLIEENGAQVVCDPVELEHKLPEMNGIVAIIITHKHSDHYQPEVLQRIIEQNPQARIFAPQDLEVNEIASRPVEKVEADVEWDMENFNLKFFGRNHAEIVAGQVPCANIGVVINDKIVNPGDSFDLPKDMKNIELLCVPSVAAWLKIADSGEYIKRAKPKMVVPVHNALFSSLGNQLSNDWLESVCDEMGAELVGLKVDESVEV